MDYSDFLNYLFIIGLVIIILTLLRLTYQRIRKNTGRQRQYEESIRLAKEAERKQQFQSAVSKSAVSSPTTRIPKADPFGSSFTGGIQGVAAKWEAEVHKLGRQIIGQIDSKMVALQTLIIDANRTANRLEILVEHLEEIARQQIEWQERQTIKSQAAQSNEGKSAEAKPDTMIIPATRSHSETDAVSTASLGVLLKELSEDIEGVRKTIQQSTTFGEPVKPAVVLRLAELQTESPVSSGLRNEAEMLSNYGIEPEEIARRLNLSLREVNLILREQRNRAGT